MNKITYFRKKILIDYLENVFSGGLILFMVLFLVFITQYSIKKTIIYGLSIWFGLILLYLIAFIFDEYFFRKNRFKKLFQSKYNFLHSNNFQIDEDLYFKGIYKNYYIEITPSYRYTNNNKKVNFDVITIFYDMIDEKDNFKNEEILSGKYFVGNLTFSNGFVSYLPNDWKKINYEFNFNQIINILIKENLKPISFKDWDKKYGSNLRKIEQENEEKNTVYLIKMKYFKIGHTKNYDK